MGTPGDKKEIEKIVVTPLLGEIKQEDSPALPPFPDMTVLSRITPITTQTLHNDLKDPLTLHIPPAFLQNLIDNIKTQPNTEQPQPGPSGLHLKQETAVSLDQQPGPSGLQSEKPSSSRKPTTASKKSLTCATCQKTFANQSKLSKHQQIHTHSPFKCDQCKKTFSSKFKLVRHVLIHSDRKPFSCTVCSRTFHRKDHLKNHFKVHNHSKELYVCAKGECKKEYTSHMSYKKHVALHAAEDGSLECQMCHKTCKTKDEILSHLKVHAGTRPVKNPDEKKFTCDKCDRRFFTRKDVRRHLVVHTGMRDFLCQFCPQRFGRKDHLIRHIKKSHSTKQQQRAAAAAAAATVNKLQTSSPAADSAVIKSETSESSLSNSDYFQSIDFLFPASTSSFVDEFASVAAAQAGTIELEDLGSGVLEDIAAAVTETAVAELPLDEMSGGGVVVTPSAGLVGPGTDLVDTDAFLNLLQSSDKLPAFDKIFQQQPPHPH